MLLHTVTVEQSPVDQLRNLSFLFPDPQRSLNNMKRTYYSLLSVTKKTAQKIFLQDLLQRDLLTQSASYVVRCIVRSSKSTSFKTERNVADVRRAIMRMEVSDAIEDLHEADLKAGR